MGAGFGVCVPILRIFDEAKAREFYVDFLGFTVAFEHRFEKDLPLYMGVTLGDCVLHLSEHHGDASPGSTVRIQTEDLDSYQQALLAQEYGYARPGPPQEQSWGTRELTVADPFGNRVIFWEPKPEGSA
jgi:uncharacterized glyoxalase superfamily protein PhnB